MVAALASYKRFVAATEAKPSSSAVQEASRKLGPAGRPVSIVQRIDEVSPSVEEYEESGKVSCLARTRRLWLRRRMPSTGAFGETAAGQRTTLTAVLKEEEYMMDPTLSSACEALSLLY